MKKKLITAGTLVLIIWIMTGPIVLSSPHRVDPNPSKLDTFILSDKNVEDKSNCNSSDIRAQSEVWPTILTQKHVASNGDIIVYNDHLIWSERGNNYDIGSLDLLLHQTPIALSGSFPTSSYSIGNYILAPVAELSRIDSFLWGVDLDHNFFSYSLQEGSTFSDPTSFKLDNKFQEVGLGQNYGIFTYKSGLIQVYHDIQSSSPDLFS